MTWGLPFATWLFLIGLRVACILIGVVCTVFALYEGKHIEIACSDAGTDENWWYWTF